MIYKSSQPFLKILKYLNIFTDITMVVVRDTKTTGLLLPEARTAVLKLLGDADDTITHAVSGKRFNILASSNKRIGIFPIDSMSPILADPNGNNKKSTTSVLGTRLDLPVATIHVENGSELISLQLSPDDSKLFITTCSGVSQVDLTDPDLSIHPMLNVADIQLGLVVAENKFAIIGLKNGSVSRRLLSDPFSEIPVLDGSKASMLCGSVEKGIVAITRGSESIVIMDTNDSVDFSGKLSSQCGDVSQVHVISKGCIFGTDDNRCGAVVTQRDVVSVFLEAELVFQFRDAINKVQFKSTDLKGSYLLVISSDTFSGRDRLELYDLSFLKPKSAGLAPLRRWDISRLTAEVEDAKIFFTNNASFLLTGPGGCVSLWEPVVRDQWFSVMANFEALNKNEPYQETEEEFDFNQKAELSTVKRTINRYKMSDRAEFNFIPNASKSADDVEMSGGGEREVELLGKEPFFPFLQPLTTWRSSGPIAGGSISGTSPHVTFFSEGGKEALKRCVAKLV